jgi:hypothetical protein
MNCRMRKNGEAMGAKFGSEQPVVQKKDIGLTCWQEDLWQMGEYIMKILK